MRVLVTGATGFLGFHLCRHLAASGHEVTALHRATSRTDQLKPFGVRLAVGDLGDIEGLQKIVTGQAVVIHAAADIQVLPRQPADLERANVEGTRNVALACRLESVEKMINVSSIWAVGMPLDPSQPADEEFRFNVRGPRFHYHLSKRLAEEAVLNEVAKGLDAVTVNPGTLFGPYRSAYRGAEIILKATRGKLIPVFSGGRCAVHVTDVVDGIVAAIQRGVPGSRYILGGENISYRDIVLRSARAFGLSPRLITVPPSCLTAINAAAAGVARVFHRKQPFASHIFDNCFQYYSWNKARLALGYNPRGFDQILEDFVAWRSDTGRGRE